jgi:hypothetical protein
MDMNNIKEVRYEHNIEKVNTLLDQGWRLLAIVSVGNQQDGLNAQYTLGMRRMWVCSCGQPMTTYIKETNRWRCDKSDHPGNPA